MMGEGISVPSSHQLNCSSIVPAVRNASERLDAVFSNLLLFAEPAPLALKLLQLGTTTRPCLYSIASYPGRPLALSTLYPKR